jgi:hypothetical protein
MVWPSIIGLVAFLLLVVIIGLLFAETVFRLLINGIVIYLVALRSLVEINKGWLREYAFGLIIAVIIMYAAGNFVRLFWAFTTFILVWFVAAQIMRIALKK